MRPHIKIPGTGCVVAYRDAWAAVEKDPSHDLMLGVLASAKTLNGDTNRQPLRYPKREDIQAIFPRHLPERVAPCGREPDPDSFLRLNLVHVAPGTQDTAGFLIRAMQEAGPRCLGLQINAAWPDRAALKVFRRRYPNARVVFQIGANAIEQVCGGWTNPHAYYAIHEALVPYAGDDLITDVLLDVSGGTGRGIRRDLLSADQGVPRGALLEMYLKVQFGPGTAGLAIGVAGGLSADTIETVAPLLVGAAESGAWG